MSITTMLRRIRGAATLGGLMLGLALGVSAPAPAFHFPWDQGHDTTDWDDPSNPGPCEGEHCDECNSTRSPVYLPTGHFVWSEQDLRFPGRQRVALTRTYNSHDPRSGMFGVGWSSSCDIGLFLARNSGAETGGGEVRRAVVMRQSNGKRYTFAETSPGVFQPPAGRFEQVTLLDDGRIQLKMPDGSVRIYHRGRLQSETSPSGLVTTYQYTGLLDGMLLERITDHAGRYLELEYDRFLGRLPRVDKVRDNAGREWNYDYDEFNRLTRVTNPDGGVRRYEYEQVTLFGDRHGYHHLKRIVDESDKVVTQVVYDGERVASYTEGANTYAYSYDTVNRKVTKTDSLGSQWVFTYSAEGLILREQDPLGNVENFEYNGNGKLTKYVDQLQHEWRWVYDERGRMTSATDPTGAQGTWEYEGENESPVRGTSPSGRVVQVAYDAQRNPISMADPAEATTTLTWADGQLREIRDPLGHTTALTTDPVGLPLTIADGRGRITTLAYDDAGRLLSITNPADETLRFEYNARGQVTARIAPSGRRTAFAGDLAGRITMVTDPAGKATSYEYDDHGRVTARVMPDGRRYEFTYRTDNLVEQVLRPDGRTVQYGYDAAKRRMSASVNGDTASYGYNARHELVSATNADGTVTLTYDAVGRLLSETVAGQTVTYAYNAEGELIGQSGAGGDIDYTRDVRGLLTGIAAPEGEYGMRYDAARRRTGLDYPHGSASSYAYDAANQLTQLAHGGPFVETLNYAHDTAGRITAIDGSQADWSYGYNVDGELTAASDGDQSFAYGYDAAGNVLGEGRTYDTGNRLTQDDAYTYAYDAEGNLTLKTDRASGARTVYAWNDWDQLTTVERYPDAAATEPESRTTLSYDPLGRRLTRNVDGAAERYAYAGPDRVGTLDGNGQPLERATFGPGIDEPLALDGAGGTRYLHADHLGSIIGVSGASGEQGRYRYGPYGETLGTAPTVVNPFRYTAREFEANDLYYYRARYYDPGMKRFIGEDPLGLAGGDTNLYAYVGGNPINLIDPLGLEWTYNSATGGLRHNGAYVATGYAGRGAGYNNPWMQSVPNTGPLPTGRYTIGPQYNSPNTGRATMALTPASDNEMYGRSAFRIHGDNSRRNGTASEGCMIFDRDIRDQIANSGDNDLVVENPMPVIIPFW